MHPTDILRGERVRLTALTRQDVPTLARWQQDAEFLRLLDATPAYPKTEEALAQWLEEQHRAGNAFVLAIRSLHGAELLGYIVLDGILWAHGVGWLCIAIGESAQRRQGYGAEALRLALAYAFHELNLHRVQLTVFGYNAAAIGLYEKLGFRREGVFREFMERDGQRYDMLLYGLLRHEWEARRAQAGVEEA